MFTVCTLFSVLLITMVLWSQRLPCQCYIQTKSNASVTNFPLCLFYSNRIPIWIFCEGIKTATSASDPVIVDYCSSKSGSFFVVFCRVLILPRMFEYSSAGVLMVPRGSSQKPRASTSEKRQISSYFLLKIGQGSMRMHVQWSCSVLFIGVILLFYFSRHIYPPVMY